MTAVGRRSDQAAVTSAILYARYVSFSERFSMCTKKKFELKFDKIVTPADKNVDSNASFSMPFHHRVRSLYKVDQLMGIR